MEPVNRVARRVVQSGTHYSPAERLCATEGMIASDTPLPMTDPKTDHQLAIIGLRRGRITVIGPYKEESPRRKNARYVIRCDCGRYELRNSKVIVNGIRDGIDDMCQRCNSLRKMKVRDISYRAGVWVE